MLFEDQRALHEDLERLEDAAAKRYLQEPRTDRERLHREHEMAKFADRTHEQAGRLKALYETGKEDLQEESERIATGDTFKTFYQELEKIKEHHKKYPSGPVETPDQLYGPIPKVEGETRILEVDSMFSGEEFYGRYFDLVGPHEQYISLKGMEGGRPLPYLHYLDTFDEFNSAMYQFRDSNEKLSDRYFTYVSNLAEYLESFMRRTRPLENLPQIFDGINDEFDKAWKEKTIAGWQDGVGSKGVTSESEAKRPTANGIWCEDCEKDFANENVWKAHLTGKRHIKNVKAREENANGNDVSVADDLVGNMHARAVAEREFRIVKLAHMMQTVRHDTRVNIERRAGMTEKEREAERETLLAELEDRDPDEEAPEPGPEGEEKIHNPLKLPMNWDGRPIPYWLYKLHGLGVEYPCEICGGFVYHGRRAFEKHFGEPRHVWGLKALGIQPGVLFREISNIEQARRLQAKVDADELEKKTRAKDVEEMEDSMGNVMPRKVFEDLQAAGMV